MEDKNIVKLLWDRDETAISELSSKYNSYCLAIAYNILQSCDDAEECVNDTWFHAWKAIPPNRPESLSTFLGKITRNIALDCYRKKHREKRGGGNLDMVLDELEDCIGNYSVEEEFAGKELISAINIFLKNLPSEQRYMFVRRYWYADSVSVIAKNMKISDNNVAVTLSRIRIKMKNYLIKGGFYK